MGKKMFTIGIPCIFTGIVSVVVMGIYGLNNMDNSLAQSNAVKAFEGAFSSYVESEADVTKVFKLYDNEKYRHVGDFLLNDSDLLGNSYNSLINNIPVEYDVICHPKLKTTKATICLGGEGMIRADSYINDEDIIFKVDEIYDGYFSIPNSNIKERYKDSLWFNLLGDITATLPDEFSLELYNDVVMSDYIISDYLVECEKNNAFDGIIKGISFEKTDAHKDFFVGESYIASNEYRVEISKSAMEGILELIEGYTKKELLNEYKAEKYELYTYISADDRLLGAKFNLAIPYENATYDVEVMISFVGTGNMYDKIITDIQFKGYAGELYSARCMLTNKSISKDMQNTTIIMALKQPYVSRIFEVEVERNIYTDEFSISAAVNIPGLNGNINYNGLIFFEDILLPENIYDIYELNLWQILNIYSSINWSFIN